LREKFRETANNSEDGMMGKTSACCDVQIWTSNSLIGCDIGRWGVTYVA